MKKIKLILLAISSLFIFSGCDLFKMDTMEDISIITTTYPLEYIINRLYGEHSLVNSIYPDGVNIDNYTFEEKQLMDYSKSNIFIYNGFGNDKDIARNLLNKNKKLLIIDGSFGMSPNYLEELWLNPSNLLMAAQNIKNGLTEYINSNYLIKEIEENYEDLKLELSELDADIKLTAENANNPTIVIANKSLNYLKKYGFNVISLDNDNDALDKTIVEVRDLIKNGKIKYIFTFENSDVSKVAKDIIDNTNAKLLKLKKIDNITDEERDNNVNYIDLMQYNLEQIKLETYN